MKNEFGVRGGEGAPKEEERPRQPRAAQGGAKGKPRASPRPGKSKARQASPREGKGNRHAFGPAARWRIKAGTREANIKRYEAYDVLFPN